MGFFILMIVSFETNPTFKYRIHLIYKYKIKINYVDLNSIINLNHG